MSHAANAPIVDSLPMFLASYENQGTQRAYEYGALTLLKWYQEHTGRPMTWEDWTQSETRQWRDDCLRTRYRGSVIQQRLTAVHRLADWGCEHGLLSVDPVRGVKSIKPAIRRPNPLTPTQQHRLLRALEQANPFHRLVLTFLLHTGLRAQELVDLRTANISLGMEHTSLAEGIPSHEVNVGEILVIGKGFRERIIPLNKTARQVCLEWWQLRPATSSPIFFVSPRLQTPMTTANLNYMCKRYRSIIPRLHPHQLRDSFATNLRRVGVPPEVVQELMGHASYETTRRYYVATEVRPEHVERIATDE